MIYELLAVELIKFDIKNNVGYEGEGPRQVSAVIWVLITKCHRDNYFEMDHILMNTCISQISCYTDGRQGSTLILFYEQHPYIDKILFFFTQI